MTENRLRILVLGDKHVPTKAFLDSFQTKFPNLLKLFQVTTYEMSEIEGSNEEVRESLGCPEEFIDKIVDIDILLTHYAPITKAVISRAQNLKIIGCARSSPVNVNVEAATEKGIPVLYAPGRQADAVADFTIALLLAEARHVARAYYDLRGKRWKQDYVGVELHEKTAGIVGFGKIGSKVAARLAGLGMKIIVYDPYIDKSLIESFGFTPVDLETLIKEADFVTVHARLTSKTYHLIGEDQIKLMKPTAYIVNTSRGAILDEKALILALRNRRISGAALDVFEHEPLPDNSPLFELDNVTITPHIAGNTPEAILKGPEMLAEDIKRFVEGLPMKYVFNSEALLQT